MMLRLRVLLNVAPRAYPFASNRLLHSGHPCLRGLSSGQTGHGSQAIQVIPWVRIVLFCCTSRALRMSSLLPARGVPSLCRLVLDSHVGLSGGWPPFRLGSVCTCMLACHGVGHPCVLACWPVMGLATLSSRHFTGLATLRSSPHLPWALQGQS